MSNQLPVTPEHLGSNAEFLKISVDDLIAKTAHLPTTLYETILAQVSAMQDGESISDDEAEHIYRWLAELSCSMSLLAFLLDGGVRARWPDSQTPKWEFLVPDDEDKKTD